MAWTEFHDNGVAYGAFEITPTYSSSTERYCKVTIAVYGMRADYDGASDGNFSYTADGWDQIEYGESPIIYEDGEWVHMGTWEQWFDTDSAGNVSTSFYAKIGVKSPSSGWKYSSKTLKSISCGTPPNLYDYVSFNANGGIGAPNSEKVTVGDSLTIPDTKPTRTGFDFLGWSTSSTATSASYTAGGSFDPNSDTTLYAVWKLKTYSVSYDANGGTGAPSNQTKTYDVDLTLTSTKPTRTGYTFKQWNTKEDGTGTVYASGGTYTGNDALTLYAIWTAIQYSVKYNANGGFGSMNDQTMTYDVEADLTANAFTKAGHTFHGWATSAEGDTAYSDKEKVKNLVSTSGGSITLYAVWSVNGITITFDAASNGGTCAEASRDIDYGSSLGTLPVASRPYYVFAGWFTAKTGGTKVTTTRTFTASTTLYAQFVIDASTSIKVSGAWKKGIPYVKVAGEWKKGYAWAKIAGVWKQGVG